jgi:PHP family Zn ribbon phosphoesterase
VPKDAIPFRTLIPVQEIIAGIYGQEIQTARVLSMFKKLLAKFGTEMNILLNAPEKDMALETSPELAKAIMLNREGKISVQPGYDGEYGVPEFPPNLVLGKPTKQKSLGEF